MSSALPTLNLVVPPQTAHIFLHDMVMAVRSMLQRAGFATVLNHSTTDTALSHVVFASSLWGETDIAQLRTSSSPRNTLIFNSAPMDGGLSEENAAYLQLLHDHVCLDYHQAHIDIRNTYSPGGQAVFEFPLLPALDFRTDFTLRPDLWTVQYDLAFYGSTAPASCVQALMALVEQRLRIKCFPPYRGGAQSAELVECIAALDLQGHSSEIFHPGPVLRPLALGMPIFCASATLPSCVDWGLSGICFLPRADFASDVAQLLKNSDRVLETSQRMLHFVNDRRWPELAAQVMHQALKALQRQ